MSPSAQTAPHSRAVRRPVKVSRLIRDSQTSGGSSSSGMTWALQTSRRSKQQIAASKINFLMSVVVYKKINTKSSVGQHTRTHVRAHTLTVTRTRTYIHAHINKSRRLLKKKMGRSNRTLLWHCKTENKMIRDTIFPTQLLHVRPSKTQISQYRLINVFAVRMKMLLIFSYPRSVQ